MLRLFIGLSFLVLLFQNCGSGVGFSSKGSTPNLSPFGEEPSLIPPVIIDEVCDSPNQIVTTKTLVFPKPAQTCDWGMNGNLDPLNTHFQARIEQKRNLNLPAGAVICDAEFDFVEQDFLYDDHFILTFNNSVIASSYNFTSQFTEGAFGLIQYNWSDMVGMDWVQADEEIFCPQIPGFSSNCSFPGHDAQGFINLHYDSKYIKAVMSNGVPENHFFRMVSIGDNDALDCEHSDVEFDIRVHYVLPE